MRAANQANSSRVQRDDVTMQPLSLGQPCRSTCYVGRASSSAPDRSGKLGQAWTGSRDDRAVLLAGGVAAMTGGVDLPWTCRQQITTGGSSSRLFADHARLFRRLSSAPGTQAAQAVVAVDASEQRGAGACCKQAHERRRS